MSKLLNRLNKTPLIAVRGSPAVRPSTYQPSMPRVALWIATVAMTVITLAVSVILPAQMDSGSHGPRMLAASKAAAPASISLATVSTIDVVAVREPVSSAVPVRSGEAKLQLGQLGTMTLPVVIRLSSDRRHDHGR
jgi:hypothetical protein